MVLFTTRKAEFYDAEGKFHGKKGFNKHDKTLRYGKGAYNINVKATYKEETPIPLIWKKRTYFYNTEYSNPYFLTKQEAEPALTPEIYDVMLETKVAKELNDLAKTSVLDFLKNPKIVFGLLVGAVIVFYLASGNKLF